MIPWSFDSALNRSCEQAANEVATQEDVDEQRGKRSEKGARHLNVPLHDLAPRQILQRYHDRLLLLRRQGNREQKLVPNIRKLPYADDNESGNRQWNDDMAIDAEKSVPVNLGRFEQLGWNADVEIPEHKRADRQTVNNVNQNESRKRIVQVDALHELNERNQDALIRDEHAEQHEGKERIGALECPLG